MEYAIYCCAKELINNAVKHAKADNIHVQLIQSQNHISLTVQDNGCGFNETTVVKGNGLANIHSRIAAFNGKFDIFSSPGGTEALIEMKIENK